MALKSSLRNKFPRVINAYHFILAWSAARRQQHPSQKIFVIGITGTKGKTTTLEVLNAILEAAGKKTALLSSLRVKIGDTTKKNTTHNSMPGRGYIQNFLHRAVAANCAYALIEVTSQGVVAHRHRFIDWNIGVLTNLAPEHIESHGSFENYRDAKLSFLKYVIERGGKVFLNRDDENFPFFADALRDSTVADFARTDFSAHIPNGSPMRSVVGGEPPRFILSDFNQENIAAAAAVAKELGIGDPVVQRTLQTFEGVPGRMNFVKVDGFTGVVDYAHTPESLAAAYRAVKPVLLTTVSKPKLICVLGAAGGGRDTWKRPEFGKIAAEYCNEIFLTEEDPYDENPEKIISEIKSGIDSAGYPAEHIHIIPDRRGAIAAAVEIMNEGDILIGTGKGSEDWIHRARGAKTPWNEKKVFEEALNEKRKSAA